MEEETIVGSLHDVVSVNGLLFSGKSYSKQTDDW